ncbi:MAG: DUF262 domain-containing protein [Bacillota bacterium]
MYETQPRRLHEWLNEIERRRLVLPRFQRMEAWDSRQVEDLLQSVIQQLPIGTVLLLQVGDRPQFKYRPLPTAPSEGERVREMLLDGQQRLMALYRSLNEKYEWVQYFVQIEPDSSTLEEELPLVRRVPFFTRKGKRYPLWPSNPEQVHARGLIPLRILHPQNEDGAVEWTEDIAGGAIRYYQKVMDYRSIVSNFELPYIALKPETKPEAVITAFTKLNSEGTPLSAYDLVVARLEAYDVDLHDKVRDMRDSVPALRYFEQVDDLDLLRAVVLLENQVPTRGNILKLEAEQVRKHWQVLIYSTRRALEFVQQEGILDAQRLPLERVLPAMFALWTLVPEGGIEEANARRLLRKYMWRSFFSDRYERGGMSPLLQDFRPIRDTLLGKESPVPCFDSDVAHLPESPEDLITGRSPKRRDRLARAILCTTLRRGAKDIHDGRPVTPDNVRQREYHHLFPVAFLQDRGLEEFQDYALNFALITWKTNRRISAKRPARYMQEATLRDGGVEELRDILATHLIPVDPFFNDDYEAFLQERAALVYNDMLDLVEGKDI